MDILIFILFILLLMVPKIILHKMVQEGHLAAAIIGGIGMIFIYPFALIWYAEFLIGYTLTYWVAFGIIFALKAITFRYEGEE